MNTFTDIHLAGSSSITCRNFARLGYSRLARGVYGHEPDVRNLDEWEERATRFMSHVHAVMVPYEGKAVLFGSTAFQMMGVALQTRLEDWTRCHLLVQDGCYRPVREGVVTHRSLSELRIWGTVQGLPLLNPVDHWLQLRGSVDDLVEAGDGFTRLVLVHAGLPQPIVNLPVYCPSVGMTYHLDLGYDKEKLGIEYDGAVHVGNREQMEIDALRRRHLQDEGWRIITVTANQLRDPLSLIHSVEQALFLRRAEGFRDDRVRVTKGSVG